MKQQNENPIKLHNFQSVIQAETEIPFTVRHKFEKREMRKLTAAQRLAKAKDRRQQMEQRVHQRRRALNEAIQSELIETVYRDKKAPTYLLQSPSANLLKSEDQLTSSCSPKDHSKTVTPSKIRLLRDSRQNPITQDFA